MKRETVSLNGSHLSALILHQPLANLRVGYLLVKFEGVAKCVQTFWLLGVCISEGLRGSFEEVLVVTHLGYWHAVELVCTEDREVKKIGTFSVL